MTRDEIIKKLDRKSNRKVLENMFEDMDLKELLNVKEVLMDYIFRERYKQLKKKYPEYILK